jgi:hypothetical protein
MNWPSEHDAKSKGPAKCLKTNIHEGSSPIYPFKSPTRFPEERKFQMELGADFTLEWQGNDFVPYASNLQEAL